MAKAKAKKCSQVSQVVDAQLSRCQKCGSTAREPYHHTVTKEGEGRMPSGEVYRAVQFRRTRCADCHQTRVDRSYEIGPRRNLVT